jgi:hypothetical protein
LKHGSVGAAAADDLSRHKQQVGVWNDTQQHEQQLRPQPAAAAAVVAWQCGSSQQLMTFDVTNNRWGQIKHETAAYVGSNCDSSQQQSRQR